MTLAQYLSYSFVDWLLHLVVMAMIVTPALWWYKRWKTRQTNASISRAFEEIKPTNVHCGKCGFTDVPGPGWSFAIDGSGGYLCPSCREVRTL